MIIKSIRIDQGSFFTEKFFHEGFNLIYSEHNSKGKTTLLRCILYGLGYEIPGTNKFDMKSTSINLVIEDDNKRMINLIRKDHKSIIYTNQFETFTFSLPFQHNDLLSLLFKTKNADILNNLLGVIYTDQEKGWTLLNRGKVISNIHFNIEELIRGLSDKNCDSLLNKKRKLEDDISKYKKILKIAEYKENVMEEADSVISAAENNEIFYKLKQLNVEKNRLQKELNRLDENIRKNTDTITLIENLKLIVRASSGEEISITRDRIVGFNESNDFLNAKKLITLSDLHKVLHDIEAINSQMLNYKKDNKLFDTETLADNFDRRISQIPVNSVEISMAIDSFEKELRKVNKSIKFETEYQNKIVDSMYKTVIKYMEELNDEGEEFNQDVNYLFTSNMKELTGAVLQKRVLAFKMAYISEIQKVLNIKLPIIMDSPRGKEIDDLNIKKMMNILKRDFSENQIIVASIYHYLDDENVIELRNCLLDKNNGSSLF